MTIMAFECSHDFAKYYTVSSIKRHTCCVHVLQKERTHSLLRTQSPYVKIIDGNEIQ